MSDPRPTVLVVNHNRTDACGVYQHGKRMVDILQGSERYRFVGVRCDRLEGFVDLFNVHAPAVCIYNYYPGTLDWCHGALAWTVLGNRPPTVHVGMAHEVTHADAHTPKPPFAKWIVTDPSFPASDIYFKTVRPLPKYVPPVWFEEDTPGPITIGTFGFALPGKGFERWMQAVKAEFGTDAHLRLHIPPAYFSGGWDYAGYARYLHNCAVDFGLICNITYDHWDDDTLLDWLAGNHLNCLFYDPNPGRGISSAVDWCVAAGRPLAITESEQFRHVNDVLGHWPAWSLRETLKAGTGQVEYLQQAWSHRRFIRDYEGIIDTLLGGGG